MSIELLKKIFLLFVSIIISLMVFEIWLRFQSPSKLGFEYKNGYFGRPIEFQRHTSVNRLGFHDVEPELKNPDGIRIILLGDSYVQGYSVPVHQIVGQRLEYYLNQQGDRSFDVISIGKSGWGQKQQLTALKKLGPQLKPNFVVTLFLSLNDIGDNYPPLRTKSTKQAPRVLRHRPRWLQLRGTDAPLFWFDDLVINRVLSHRLAVFLSRHQDSEIPNDYLVYAEEYSQEWKNAWQEMERLILLTQQFCHSLGANFLVISASTPQGVYGQERGVDALIRSYPAMSERRWNLDKPDQLLSSITKKYEIPFLALEPRFRVLVQNEGAILHWKYDGHWNAKGNNEAGRMIADFLRMDLLTKR